MNSLTWDKSTRNVEFQYVIRYTNLQYRTCSVPLAHISIFLRTYKFLPSCYTACVRVNCVLLISHQTDYYFYEDGTSLHVFINLIALDTWLQKKNTGYAHACNRIYSISMSACMLRSNTLNLTYA